MQSTLLTSPGQPIVVVIIPAFNEENSVGRVVRDIPDELVGEIIVVNNNSNDQTAVEAARAGATVLDERIQGYGRACLRGIAYAQQRRPRPDIVVFLDADYSDFPGEMPALVAPILNGSVDMVIGSRALGNRQRGSMTPQQVFGNWLATSLLRLLYGVRYTDLGPFRAIRFDTLLALDMQDKTYGWTVEMQLKAAKQGFRSTEVPVSYRKRIGHSKISGTIKGTILAGYKILTTIFRYA
ncbi:glycosyltransferase family 2 protein [Spirosoma rhododendri]|uniref:Glycosyltransferase family 2 protein n=1 Tax=Spirosoma rhododendri TaxID=2728024 RepID=A0A7L5DJU8_9BACT|nr:glycosyltransferase family 2 protein [Spirosoma rhododendri]QJD77423.1 glycosyltransferase family 2 protein [Spirosoma rhododendri]